MRLVMPGCRRACDPGIRSERGGALLGWIAGSGPATTREGEKEQAGWGGAAPGAGGLDRDTGTCSSARTCARRCSIRTLALAPSAFATPAGRTREPEPSGTSLRTLLTSRSCFVLNEIGLRVKAEASARASATRQQVILYDRRAPSAEGVNIR